MTAADLIAALDLPPAAGVDQRVPKKLFQEHAPGAADRRRVGKGFDEVRWVAALKPATVGVEAYRDEVREYLEIAVLSARLRPRAKTARLVELIHRAIPYPVLLAAEQGERVSISLAHKRWSQSQAGATVLDGDVVAVEVDGAAPSAMVQEFADAIRLAGQPSRDLLLLYQRWMDAVVALLAVPALGTFLLPRSPEHAAARRDALRECARLDAEIAGLRAAAERERQLPRQVQLNLEMKRVQQHRAVIAEKL
jgi:hypothetical protein